MVLYDIKKSFNSNDFLLPESLNPPEAGKFSAIYKSFTNKLGLGHKPKYYDKNGLLHSDKSINELGDVPDKIYRDPSIAKRIRDYASGAAGNIKAHFYVATLNDDGSEAKSTTQKAKNFLKSPVAKELGKFLILDIGFTLGYMTLAATLGNGPSESAQEFYGRTYYPWAFPFNRDGSATGPFAVARNVNIGMGTPDTFKVVTNIAVNAANNLPAYLVTGTVLAGGIVAGHEIHKKHKKEKS
jgi:hypothetical protein